MTFLTHTRTFVAIADMHSIAKAAKLVGLSAPMASRQLRCLEADLGVELVRRTTRNLQLTSAGMTFLDHARRLIADAQAAKDAVRPTGVVQGTLTVDLPLTFDAMGIELRMLTLIKQHSGLRLDLRFREGAIEHGTSNADITIRIGRPPMDTPSYIARQVGAIELTLCASPEFAKYHQDVLQDAQSLSSISCLVEATASKPTRWTLNTQSGLVEVIVDGPLRSDNIQLLCEGATAGLGVALLPHSAIFDRLESNQLVTILARQQVAAPPPFVWGLYHHSQRGSPAIHAFLDHLENMLSADPKRNGVSRLN